MKVGIVAGGVGSRLADETTVRAKPMIEIGERPLLWHILRHYRHFGFNEFVVAVGYKGEQIKHYLADYLVAESDIRIDVGRGEVTVHPSPSAEDWIVDVIDTGRSTESGGRVKRMAPWLGDGTFMLTFGDVVSDVDIDAVLAAHRAGGKLATVTAVHPPARFGELHLDGDEVIEFSEKPIGQGWIIGGYMVMEPDVFGYIEGDVPLSPEPIERLAKDGQLTVYRHEGFWHGVDTLGDRKKLEKLWDDGTPPWRLWD